MYSRTWQKSVTDKPTSANGIGRKKHDNKCLGYNHPGYDHLYVVLISAKVFRSLFVVHTSKVIQCKG